jgi:hypothetical protein
MLAFLADELVEFDTRYRMRDTHDRMAAKQPASPALAVLWLERFQDYYPHVVRPLGGRKRLVGVSGSAPELQGAG